jgi:hypothetical protein
MKEATGELNMTIVTLIAVAALGALFYWVIWPIIQKSIVNQTCKTYGSEWTAISNGEMSDKTSGSAKVYDWYCCPEGAKTEADGCIGTSLSGSSDTE